MRSGHWSPAAAVVSAQRSILLRLRCVPEELRPPLPPAGIGKSIARKLAGQGLNVVLAALGDELLDTTHKELSEQYPRVTIRKVRRRMARPGLLPDPRRTYITASVRWRSGSQCWHAVSVFAFHLLLCADASAAPP